VVIVVVVHSHPLLFKQIQGGEVMGNKEAHLPTSLMRYLYFAHKQNHELNKTLPLYNQVQRREDL